MTYLTSDRSHLRSAALADAVPRGLGNTVAGRFLREHERIVTAHFERAGIEINEFARILASRLGRIALQISELERRLDRTGKLNADELRIYTSISTQYTGIMRELLLHPHKHRQARLPGPSSEERAPMADILAEMPK